MVVRRRACESSRRSAAVGNVSESKEDLRPWSERTMKPSRRLFVRSLCASAAVFTFDQLIAGEPLGVQFVNVAREAGLNSKTVFGGETRNRYLLETTGCGVAFFDYDNDGWLDIFLVNGSRFETTWGAGE